MLVIDDDDDDGGGGDDDDDRTFSLNCYCVRMNLMALSRKTG